MSANSPYRDAPEVFIPAENDAIWYRGLPGRVAYLLESGALALWIDLGFRSVLVRAPRTDVSPRRGP